jgi:hypothetical protein
VRSRLVQDLLELGVEEVGFVELVEVDCASEEWTRAEDEMVLGRASGLEGNRWKATAMGVPESRAGQRPEPALEQFGLTATREDASGLEAARA